MMERRVDGGVVEAALPVRLFARAIDVAVVVGIIAALGKAIGFGYDWLIVGAAIVLMYFAVMDVLWGATLGKLLLKLRIIGPEGRTLTMEQALRREFFTALGAIPLVGPFLAMGSWGWIIWSIHESPTRQGKHDMLAGGTRVVRRIGARDA
jgi:uncharacterized RDD family membrane protein YckC